MPEPREYVIADAKQRAQLDRWWGEYDATPDAAARMELRRVIELGVSVCIYNRALDDARTTLNTGRVSL